MGLFSKKLEHDPDASPPEWSAAPEPIHAFGKYDDAPDDEYQAGEDFCARYPVSPPTLLSSHVVERIHSHGPKAWGMETPSTWRFKGAVTRTEHGTTMIETKKNCPSTCVLSDLPILAGLYDVPGDMEGVYFEVTIKTMHDTVAVGTACQPYPDFRLPGWNRLSAGFHLDDLRKFFEDPDGGRDYVGEGSDVKGIKEGDVVGCGYEFGRGVVFFTYNGRRLPDAFVGVYVPRTKWDVYAAVGVSDECEVQVNFGGEEFRWKEGNSGRWRVDRHVGSGRDEVPPVYS
ncbi:hypothetical protein JOM56_013854 [Amanita muscaria]